MESLMISGLSYWGVEGFKTPFWLWGMLLLPVFWWLSLKSRWHDDFAQYQQTKTLTVKHSLLDLHLAEKKPKFQDQGFWKQQRAVWVSLQVFRSLIVTALLVALAQPFAEEERSPQPPEKTQRELVFVIESSASLLLPDYQLQAQSVPRIEAVKQVLDRFMAGLVGNRFGLVVYAEQAYSLLPLTMDHEAARLSLLRLKPYMAGRTDEAMGEALGLALEQNRQLSVLTEPEVIAKRKEKVPARKRVVVLISDGLSRSSRLKIDEAINYAQQMQIPVYTIGVGASSESADTRKFRGLIYQPLEEESLKKIAEETGGRYFRVDGREQLENVLQQIDSLEGVPVTLPSPQKNIQPLFVPFLMIGLSLIALYIVWFGLVNYLMSARFDQVSSGGDHNGN